MAASAPVPSTLNVEESVDGSPELPTSTLTADEEVAQPISAGGEDHASDPPKRKPRIRQPPTGTGNCFVAKFCHS